MALSLKATSRANSPRSSLAAGQQRTRTLASMPAMIDARQSAGPGEGAANLAEVSIGHAVIADALSLGMHETVKAFRRAIGDL